MKKLLLLVFCCIFLITPVSALENKIFFSTDGDRIYYDSLLIDENIFMKHLDMVPGKFYTDELVIENGTDIEYKVFFKVGAVSDELLDNIFMKIYLDDTLIYDGVATGVDYLDNGVNLQNAIFLKSMSSGARSTMRVETSLSKEYSNINNYDISSIDWSFYAQYGDDDAQEMIPKTGIAYAEKYPILSLSIISFVVFMVLFFSIKRKKENN